MERTEKIRPSTGETLAAVFVGLLTAAYFVFGASLLYAKWIDFDPYLLDFGKCGRLFDAVIHGVPYENTTVYYAFVHAGILPVLLFFSTMIRPIFVIFAAHLLPLTVAVPLLYRVARQSLPGVILPLTVVIAFVLSPTIDLITIGFMRLNTILLVFFLLTVFYLNKNAARPALRMAMIGSLVRIDGVPFFFLLGLMVVMGKNRELGKRIMLRALVGLGIFAAAVAIFWAATGIQQDLWQVRLLGPAAGFPSLESSLAHLGRTLLTPASYKHCTIVFQFFLLPLLAPLWLLPAAANLLYVVVSAENYQSIPLIHSLAAPGTFLVPYLHPNDTDLFAVFLVAMIQAIGKIDRWATTLARREIRPIIGGVLIAAFLAAHWFCTPPSLGPVPLTPSFNLEYYRPTPHSQLAWRFLAAVPRDRFGLLQFSFAERADALPRGIEFNSETTVRPETQYVLCDLFAFSPNMSKRKLIEKIRSILLRRDFAVAGFEDGIIYLVRHSANERNGEVAAYIDENYESLSRNLASPYRDGWLPREEALHRTFGPTMLPMSPTR
jgi:hypothetical protein